MKRFFALFLALLMLASLCACSGGSGSSSDNKTTQNTPSAPATSVETPSSSAPEGSTPTPAVSTPTPLPSTPTVQPSTSSDTPVDPLAKKMNNQETSTEDDLDVIHVGIYEFVTEDGKKLGYDGSTVSFYSSEDSANANTQFLVSFQNAGTNSTGRAAVKYVIYAGDSVAKSLYCIGDNLSVNDSNDRLSNYQWNIKEYEDGSVALYALNPRKYLQSTEAGVSFNYSDSQPGIHLQMNLITEEITSFIQIISEKGDIVMRYSDKLRSRAKIPYERMVKLTNDMQVARDSYYEMTDFLPYETIVIRIYQKEPYFGYVYGGWNVISFNLDNALSDLAHLPKRDKLDINDWNFCLLHEMGHMFDYGRAWRFYGEFSNNFKLAQVLHMNSDVGAAAAVSEKPTNMCYKGDEIKEMWNTIPAMTSTTGFNLNRLLYLFVDYAETIGWDNVSLAYKEIQAMPTQISGEKKRFELFTSTMAKYAPNNLNIKDTFAEGELELILAELN